MIIFSTVFKILNKLKGNLILYTVILLAITLFNTTSGNMNHYEATKPDILIVNKDRNNEITKGFVSYLKEQATLKDIDINDQEKVDDALFYRDISYVVYIPENFGDDLVNDKNLSSTHLKLQTNNYLHILNVLEIKYYFDLL